MPKDYANREQLKSKKKKSAKKIPWLIILLLLLIIILVAGGILYIKNYNKHEHATTRTRVEKKGAGAVVEEAQPINLITGYKKTSRTQPPKSDAASQQPIQFDFYNMLPKMQVTITNNPNSTNKIQPDNNQYLVQLASFPNADDAATYQAEMKRKGFETKILITPRGKRTWYRVQIGPFKDRAKAEDLRDKLQKQDVNCILLQMSK